MILRTLAINSTGIFPNMVDSSKFKKTNKQTVPLKLIAHKMTHNPFFISFIKQSDSTPHFHTQWLKITQLLMHLNIKCM